MQRHLLTGTLDSLEKVKGAYGKESKTYKAAGRLMAKGIGMVQYFKPFNSVYVCLGNEASVPVVLRG